MLLDMGMCVCEQIINMLLELLLVWGKEGKGRKKGEKKKRFSAIPFRGLFFLFSFSIFVQLNQGPPTLE